MNMESVALSKMDRRQVLKYLGASTVGYLFFPRAVLEAQQEQRQTITKRVVPDAERIACQYDSIIPNAKPQWQTGQVLRYRTTKPEDKASGVPNVAGKGGEIVLRREAIPLEQAITIGKKMEFRGESCILIEREGTVDFPSFKGAMDRSKSYIRADGQIRYSESELTLTDGQSTSVSTNTNSGFTPISDLHFFYGYWMLALAPNFSWECLKNVSEGAVLQKLKVNGMANIGGRECFVVERTYRTESQGSEITSYWIDKTERIAIQVKTGKYTIRLVT
jgi:hypothetical protein